MHRHFTIPAHDIDTSGLSKSFELPASWLALALGDTDVEATGSGKADVRLSKSGQDVYVNGKVAAPLKMPCARCLKDVIIPVDTEISLLLRPLKGEHGTHSRTHGAHGHASHGHSSHGPHVDKDAATAKSAKDAAAARKEAAKEAAAAKKAAAETDDLAKDAPAKDDAPEDAPAPVAVAKAAAKASDAKAGAKASDAKAAAKPAKDASKANGAPKKHRSHDEEEEYEFSSEEADTDVYDGETVVLDDFLREALLLEVPSFPLCSEDCPGIRPSAKATPERSEAGLDPRLSPLRALKTKLMLAATSKDAAGKAPDDTEGKSEGSSSSAERPAPAAKPARPKIHAHRTQGAVAKAKAKHSPKKKAK